MNLRKCTPIFFSLYDACLYIYICKYVRVFLFAHTHTYISSSVIYCLKGNSLIREHPACKRIEIEQKLLFAKELSTNIDLVVE
jgi:hypothetical protein